MLKVLFVLFLKETPVQTQEPQSAISYWVMVAVTGLLAFYSILITAIFISYWVRNHFPLLYMLFVLSSSLRLFLPYLPQAHWYPSLQDRSASLPHLCCAPRQLEHQMLTRWAVSLCSRVLKQTVIP